MFFEGFFIEFEASQKDLTNEIALAHDRKRDDNLGATDLVLDFALTQSAHVM